MRSALKRVVGGILIATVAASGAMTLTGCGEKKEEVKAPPPPPPPPPPKPVDVGALTQTMRADKRVQFPAERAPLDERVARAVISLADALAKGDAESFAGQLTGEAKDVLEQLRNTGQWEEATGKIEAVRVVELAAPGNNPASFGVTLAIQEPGAAYLVRFGATLTGDRYLFNGQSGGRLVKPRANQFDDGVVD